jgi:hypothetical protein
MSHALGRDASVQELRRLTNEELTRYTALAPVFAQVVAYLTHITTTVNIYVIVTGGDWAAAIGNAFGLNYETQLWLLALHVALSIIVVISLLGMGNNFIQRLNFLDWLGVAFWPTIRQLGGHEFAWHGPSGDITVSPLSPDQARTRPQALTGPLDSRICDGNASSFCCPLPPLVSASPSSPGFTKTVRRAASSVLGYKTLSVFLIRSQSPLWHSSVLAICLIKLAARSLGSIYRILKYRRQRKKRARLKVFDAYPNLAVPPALSRRWQLPVHDTRRPALGNGGNGWLADMPPVVRSPRRREPTAEI